MRFFYYSPTSFVFLPFLTAGFPITQHLRIVWALASNDSHFRGTEFPSRLNFGLRRWLCCRRWMGIFWKSSYPFWRLFLSPYAILCFLDLDKGCPSSSSRSHPPISQQYMSTTHSFSPLTPTFVSLAILIYKFLFCCRPSVLNTPAFTPCAFSPSAEVILCNSSFSIKKIFQNTNSKSPHLERGNLWRE